MTFDDPETRRDECEDENVFLFLRVCTCVCVHIVFLFLFANTRGVMVWVGMGDWHGVEF
jgi:hypothetical protein